MHWCGLDFAKLPIFPMYADHAALGSRDSAPTDSFGPIEVGMDAPDFEWPDEEGSSARLSDLRGEPVLLAFFAAEWNPARTYQLQIYNEALQLLPNAGRVLGLAQDGHWCEVMFDGEQLRFPLLGNLGVDGDLARRYGVLGSQALFVIDAGGTVRWRHVAADGMEPRLDDLTEALRSSAECRHGLAAGNELHPMQAAFIREDGLQCGYCTPGQIMPAVACVQEGHATSEMEIREWMSGNICRCGAYTGIRNASASARDELGHSG